MFNSQRTNAVWLAIPHKSEPLCIMFLLFYSLITNVLKKTCFPSDYLTMWLASSKVIIFQSVYFFPLPFPSRSSAVKATEID